MSSKARLNWLLRQIKIEPDPDVFVRLNWPGRSDATQFSLTELIGDPNLCEKDKSGLQVISFHVFIARRLGAKFTQQVNFIKELEDVVPFFYHQIGQNLFEWRKPAPRIKPDRLSAGDVSVAALQEETEEWQEE